MHPTIRSCAGLLTLLAAALPAVAQTPSSGSENLVVDGSFEAAYQADGTWGFYRGSPSTGWYAEGGPTSLVELRTNLVGSAQHGRNFAELDSQYGNSVMSQVLNTVAGQTYQLSFYFSSRPDSTGYIDPALYGGTVVPASSNGLSFNVGAGWVAAPTLAANYGANNDWYYYSTTFKATGSQTTLSFMATGTSDTFGTSLDNVVVTTDGGGSPTPVPEPASMSMLLAGLALVAWRRRSTQKLS